MQIKTKNIRKKKIFVITLFTLYALAVTLVLIFGAKLSVWLANKVDLALNKKEITDVTVNVKDGAELLADRDHYLQFIAHGEFTGDPGLRFTSLNPEYVGVTSTGTVWSKINFEGDYLDGQIKVTSKYDEDFEKIFTFRFVKKIPDEFIAAYYVKGYAHGVKNLRVGVPIYVFSHTEQKSGYNVYDYTVEYDEEYFTMADDGALIPIKQTPAGVTTACSVTYYNGRSATTSPFTITLPAEEVETIDEVRLNGIPSDEFVGTRNKGMTVTLYSEGKQVMTDYKIEAEKPSDMRCSKASHPTFYTAGDKLVTFTLPNGFSKTITIKIRNVIEFPTVSGVYGDGSVIDMDFSEVRTFKFNFRSTVTYDKVSYEFDNTRIEVTASGRSFTVSPKKAGETTLKLTVSDGFDTLSETYTIKVIKSANLFAMIAKNVALFVAKVMGHICMFALLGLLAMDMFRFLGIFRAADRFVLYCMMGLPIAALTEYAQTFIPGRTGRVKDVLIDMTGFFIGAVVGLMIKKVLSKRERKEREKALNAKRKEKYYKLHENRKEPVFSDKRKPSFTNEVEKYQGGNNEGIDRC